MTSPQLHGLTEVPLVGPFARAAAAHREWRRALDIAAMTDDDDVDEVLLAGVASATEDLRRARAVLRGAGGVA